MLERATACFRAQAPRSTRSSRRRLHHTFWTHGAGDLDLPPCVLFNLPASANLPLKHNNHHPGLEISYLAGTPPPTASDGSFLDFLYPPQALVWLQQAHSRERWEKRNAKRLPDGFIQVSRGRSGRRYAHSTPAGTSKVEDEKEKNDIHEDDEGQADDPDQDSDMDALAKSETVEHRSDFVPSEGIKQDALGVVATEHGPGHPHTLLTDSSGDLAELETISGHKPDDVPLDPLRHLRSLLAGGRAPRGSDEIGNAWSIYNMLHEDDKDDAQLKADLLQWFAARDNAAADAHCISLYLSMSPHARSLPVYLSTLDAFLRQEDADSALSLHAEALSNVPDDHQISKILFRRAVEASQWKLALQVIEQHHRHHSGSDHDHHRAKFWLEVREIPDLVNIAVRFVDQCQQWKAGEGSGLNEIQDIGPYIKMSVRMSEEAIHKTSLTPIPEALELLPRKITKLCDVVSMGVPTKAPRIFRSAITAILKNNGVDLRRRSAVVEFWRAYRIISYMYQLWRKSADFRPPEYQLDIFLNRLLVYHLKKQDSHPGLYTITMGDIITDWIGLYRELPTSAVHKLLAFNARAGNVQRVESMFQYLRLRHPLYTDQKESLWTLIYVHARRGDVASAIDAFKLVRSLAIANNDAIEPKWWGVLLHAHSRADDLNGALLTFQKALDSGLKPNVLMLQPILEMVAKRGDVDGVTSLLKQWDALTGEPRTTLFVTSYMYALVRADRVQDAEDVLLRSIEQRRTDQIRGSLTPCFNALLVAYALRSDMAATMRIYRQMKSEGVQMDEATYGAIMRTLVVYRQPDAAMRVMDVEMRREGFEPTAFHYSIVMLGFNKVKSHVKTLAIQRRMERRKILPTLATQKQFLIAETQMELEARRRRGDWDVKDLPQNTFALSEKTVASHNGFEVAVKEPVGSFALSGLVTADVISPLMQLRGRRENIETVEKMIDIYRSRRSERGDLSQVLPLPMLTARIGALVRRKQYDEAEANWLEAKRLADTYAARVAIPDFRDTMLSQTQDVDGAARGLTTQGLPSAIARTPYASRNRLLCPALGAYLKGLTAQNRGPDMIKTWIDLQKQGYTFDGMTWNRFVEYCCWCSPPMVLFAFAITERHLIAQFPGWDYRSSQFSVMKSAQAQAVQYMRARHVDSRRIHMPSYRTMVHLAAALQWLRNTEAQGSESIGEHSRLVGSVAQVTAQAPQTLRYVQDLPYVNDLMQRRLFGGQGKGMGDRRMGDGEKGDGERGDGERGDGERDGSGVVGRVS